MAQGTTTNWWDAFPVSNTPVQEIVVTEAVQLVAGGKACFVDVRSADEIEKGGIDGALNYRAQTFYPRRMEIAQRLRNYPAAIFFCSKSNGRGPRCARWHQDALTVAGIKESKALIMQGGYAAWHEWKGSEMAPEKGH